MAPCLFHLAGCSFPLRFHEISTPSIHAPFSHLLLLRSLLRHPFRSTHSPIPFSDRVEMLKTGGVSREFVWYNGSLERDSVLLYETCFCLLALSAMNEIGDSMGRGTLEQVICSIFQTFEAYRCGMSDVAFGLELNGIARASFRILHYCKNEEREAQM